MWQSARVQDLLFSPKFRVSLQHITSKLTNSADQLIYQYFKVWFSQFSSKSCHHRSCRSTNDRLIPLGKKNQREKSQKQANKQKKKGKQPRQLLTCHSFVQNIMHNWVSWLGFFKFLDSLSCSLEQPNFVGCLENEIFNYFPWPEILLENKHLHIHRKKQDREIISFSEYSSMFFSWVTSVFLACYCRIIEAFGLKGTLTGHLQLEQLLRASSTTLSNPCADPAII